MKTQASEAIIRDRYNISSNPDIAVQVYRGRFAGLVRVEVEFGSISQAESFKPLSWMGKEITGSPLARDSKLLDLTNEEFKKLLEENSDVARGDRQ